MWKLNGNPSGAEPLTYLQLAPTTRHSQYLEVLAMSNDVIINSLLTLIYRALPPKPNSILNEPCYQAARAALQAHQRAVQRVQSTSGYEWDWSTYMNW